MSKGSIITLLVLVVVTVGGFWGYKVYRVGVRHAEVREGATEWLNGRQFYNQNVEYIEGLVDFAHDEAFDKAYSMGGLTSQAEFSEETYYFTLLKLLEEETRSAGRDDIAEQLAREAYVIRPYASINE